MQDFILKTNSLVKQYGKSFALKDVSISVPIGSIYGLVGENGAGKTTFFRIITGLCEKSGGEFAFFINGLESEFLAARSKMGCTIEAPAIYKEMSVLENMKLQCIMRGITDHGRIDEILSLVNLTEEKSQKASHLSYGMKQRLALAFALIHKPKFLVLDEPTNGLDPLGIIEFRELFLKLNKEYGTTILIASHILSELQHLATHYGIIHKGKILKELTAQEFFEQCNKHIKIVVDDVKKATIILQQKSGIGNYKINGSTILLYDYFDTSADIATVLLNGGVRVSEISTVSETFESYFVKLISGEENSR